jgi:hypothetical protein
MTVITLRTAVGPGRGRPYEHRIDRPAVSCEPATLVAIAATAALVGSIAPAAAFALVAAIATGSWMMAASVLVMSVPFLAVTVPTMAVWLVGAIGTRGAIDRLNR